MGSGDSDKRHTFVVEATDGTDLLLRLLGPFAVQEARITDIRMDHRPDGVRVVVEASGVSAERADLIARRLDGLAAVRTVGHGWRCLPAAAPPP